MLKDDLMKYFLDKPGTFEDHVNKSKITLNLASESIVTINNEDEIEIKMTSENFNHLKHKYNDIVPSKNEGMMQWSKIKINANINIDEIFEMIDTSYDDVINTLPKEEKKEILDLEW